MGDFSPFYSLSPVFSVLPGALDAVVLRMDRWHKIRSNYRALFPLNRFRILPPQTGGIFCSLNICRNIGFRFYNTTSPPSDRLSLNRPRYMRADPINLGYELGLFAVLLHVHIGRSFLILAKNWVLMPVKCSARFYEPLNRLNSLFKPSWWTISLFRPPSPDCWILFLLSPSLVPFF